MEWQKNQCWRCGDPNHTRHECPIPLDMDERTPEQAAKAKAYSKKRSAVKKARDAAVKAAKEAAR